jgi:hypothetical protein
MSAALRSGVEYLFEILAKAHVEHLVGFVEHGDAKAAQIERAAFEMVAQPPRRPDDDVRALRERPALLDASMPPTQVAIRAPALP